MNSEIIIISGEKKSGKTELLLKLIDFARSNSISIGGLISQKTFNSKDDIIGFDLLTFSSGSIIKQLPFATTDLKTGSEISCGRFNFSQYVFDIGNDFIEKNIDDVLIIDEIGQIELNGGGWSNAVKCIKNKSHQVVILSVRFNLIKSILSHFQIDASEIIIINHNDFDEILNLLSTKIKKILYEK